MTQFLRDVFQFCPACGTANATPGTNPLKCAKCDFTFYFGPVAAVGAIVSDGLGQVLFVRRAKDPGKGKLGLPGGFVDAGESLETALVREVLEETNLKAIDVQYLTSGPNKYVYRGTELAVTDVFFLCTVESFEPMQALDGEVTEFHLVKPTQRELGDMAFESNRIALQLYLSK